MKIGDKDDFERQYMAKFRAIASPHGVFVEYAADRAGRDLGLHFTQPNPKGGKLVLPSLAWFQMKGIMPATLSLEDYNAAQRVSVVLYVSHLRFWYVNLQPTYLVVYVGSADEFLAIDLKQWVRDNYGDKILTLDQETITIHVEKKNKLDDHLFRLIMERNLVPSLRDVLSQDDDTEIRRFLRDSSMVKSLALSGETNTECRLRVGKYMSKMRTEVYFETRAPDGEWIPMRSHWEYAMDTLPLTYPFLSFKPKLAVTEHERIEIDEYDGHEIREVVREFRFEDSDEDNLLDDEEQIDPECLMEIEPARYSYSTTGYGEMMVHELAIELNEVGRRWAETLRALEAAEIISVSMEPHFISVAPWHSRDV